MKSGTAQKLVLNMISTVTMIRLGYVKGNRMTNMRSSNEKLKDRGVRILMAETFLGEDAAEQLIRQADGDLRVALVMNSAEVNAEDAKKALVETDFVVESAVESLK